MPNSHIAFIAALALGATFLISGLSKLRDPEGFVLGVLEYAVLPPRLAKIFGRALPVVEVACGAALLTGLWATPAAFLALAMLVSFMIAVVINLLRGRRLACHCLGAGSDESLGWVTITRLSVYIVLVTTILGWWGEVRRETIPSDRLPAMLTALGIVLGMHILGALPTLWRIWRTTVVPSPTIYLGRVRLRDEPLRRVSAGTTSNGSGAVHLK